MHFPLYSFCANLFLLARAPNSGRLYEYGTRIGSILPVPEIRAVVYRNHCSSKIEVERLIFLGRYDLRWHWRHSSSAKYQICISANGYSFSPSNDPSSAPNLTIPTCLSTLSDRPRERSTYSSTNTVNHLKQALLLCSPSVRYTTVYLIYPHALRSLS
jgi:hypothetical protein